MKPESIKGIVALNIATFGTVTVAEAQALAEWLLKVLLLLLTISLTARKWYLVEKKARERKRSETEILERLP